MHTTPKKKSPTETRLRDVLHDILAQCYPEDLAYNRFANEEPPAFLKGDWSGLSQLSSDLRAAILGILRAQSNERPFARHDLAVLKKALGHRTQLLVSRKLRHGLFAEVS